jgi:hypothetical protein
MALSESKYAGEFLLAEGNGTISRAEITIAAAAGAMPAGQVLGKLTVGGKYVAYNPSVDPADGSESAAGILYAAVPDLAADQTGVAIVRHAEVDGDALTGNDSGGTADLAALDIIVR